MVRLLADFSGQIANVEQRFIYVKIHYGEPLIPLGLS